MLGALLFGAMTSSVAHARPVFLFVGLNRSDSEIRKFKEFIESPSGANMDFEYLPKPGQTVAASDVNALVHKVIASGRSIQSFSLSGHSRGDFFNGEDPTNRGSISRDEIKDVVDANPAFGASVRSIFMHGCYTGTTRAFELWRGLFPNSVFRAGFNSNANDSWNGSQGEVQRILKAVIKQAPKLSKIADGKALKSSYMAILDGNRQNVPCSIETGDDRCLGFWVGPNGKQIDLKAHDKVCPKSVFRSFYRDADHPEDYREENGKLFEKFKCYSSIDVETDSDCKDVPEETHDIPPDHPNLIRRLYSLLQDIGAKECAAELQGVGAPSIDQVASLVFNHAVRTNFLKYFRPQLLKMRAAKIDFSSIVSGSSTRKDWQDFALRMSAQFRNIQDPDTKEAVRVISTAIQKVVLSPTPDCPNFDWIYPISGDFKRSLPDRCSN